MKKSKCPSCGREIDTVDYKEDDVTIQIPMHVALEIFSETGDLVVNQYPALEKLAEIISEKLKLKRN